jgi:UDP-4-amino-4,6-dideoxy-N-acetyl-beta-L-altrosamine N-acetyltransferase
MNNIESTSIREMTINDLLMVLAWRNHPSIRVHMFSDHEISKDEHFEWFSKVNINRLQSLWIVVNNTEPIGFVQFKKAHNELSANWGFYVSPNAKKGSGKILGQLALDLAFGELSIKKVFGEALKFNNASIGFHQHLGFIQESSDDTNSDILKFSLSKVDWISNKKNLKEKVKA